MFGVANHLSHLTKGNSAVTSIVEQIDPMESCHEKEIGSSEVRFGDRLRNMAASSFPVLRTLHKVIVPSVLAQPPNLFRYGDVATILRIHQRDQILDILKSTIHDLNSEVG